MASDLAGIILRVWWLEMKGDAATAQAAFTAARARQEEAVRARPDDGPILCVLGLIDAALGRKEDALREGHRALELAPIAKDSSGRRGRPLFLCRYLCVDWRTRTWQSSNWKLSRKSQPVRPTGTLRLSPYWDSLRGDPRFEKIVNSLAPR